MSQSGAELRLRAPAPVFAAVAAAIYISGTALIAALVSNLGQANRWHLVPAEALTLASPAVIAALVLGLRLRRYGMGGLARILTEAAVAGAIVGAMWPLSGLMTDQAAGARLDWGMASRVIGLGALIGTAASLVASAAAAQITLQRPPASGG
jgi:hypothetical protein